MKTTPEQELQFLRKGLKNRVLQDLVIAQAHVDRMRDLCDVGIEAACKEMQATSAAEFQAIGDLGDLQEVLLRQHAVLTPILASLQTAYGMFASDLETENGNIYERLAELIANNPELLENKAAENSVASGDNDSTTQAKRWELNRLINQEGES